MAKIEINKVIASSKDNFLVFANDSYTKPMVTFYFTNGGSGDGKIHIKDALNDDGFNKVIVYSAREIISDSSFKFVSGDRTANTFALLECLRMNNIFYDIQLVSDIPNVGILIKAYIDTSTKYIITADSDIVVGGSFSSYVPKEPNKFVLMINDGSNQIMLDKYVTESEVGFNVSSPFEHLSFKYPKNIRMLAYHIENNTVIPDSISNNEVIILPTTLTKFSDVDVFSYHYSYSGQRVNMLTNNFNRYYNYGEICGLSMLTDNASVTLVKNYYTLSGKFLGSDSDLLFSETVNMRKDFYFTLDLEGIETSTNKQVGYVELFASNNGVRVTNILRYNIVPKCNENHEIFFINELGGIDSFNFLGESKYSTKIKSLSTYIKNPTRKFEETKELEIVRGKKNEVENILTTTIIDKDTAKWLNELSKSKYPFLYIGSSGSRFERIVVTDIDISLSDRENTFEVEMTYKNGDNSFKL